MEIVLIDEFFVPKESRTEFLEAARRSEKFISTPPRFVEGFLYEKEEGTIRYNILTTAVWKDKESFEAAKERVAAEYQKQGFSPQETMTKLKVEMIRSTYTRRPFEI